MNIRGKSSPVQSNIRTVTTGSAPRGQTPPPPQQLRGQFEDPTHFHSAYQAAAPPLQQQPAYLDMNKPAAGRVGQGLPQTAQAYVPRPHQQQAYNQLVADAQEQTAAPMAWNAPQQNYYIPNPTQGVRPQRMPAMNNGQVPGSNFALMPGMPASMPFMANQMQGYNGSNLQNPSQQFMVGGQFMQYQQPRMPYPTMQQQSPMYPMGYGAPAPSSYPFYQAPMQMANPSRPSSTGPQGAGGHVQKQGRSRNILKLADPNTGEDLTDKVFKAPATEDTDSNAQESQAHRNAVTLEFATKVAILANNKDSDTSHEAQSTTQAPSAEAAGLSTPATEAVTAATASSTPPAQSVAQDNHAMLNGEPDQQNIPPAHSVEAPAPTAEPAPAPVPAPAPAPASFSVPASAEREEAKQPVETVAAAPDVQTPSPAQAAAPVVPVADTAPSANVVAVEPKEMSPAPVIEKPSAAPAAAVPEKEPTPTPEAVPKDEPVSAAPMQTTAVSAADAASLIGDSASGQEADSKPAPQASGPQPQRQDARKNKKNKKDLNKKSKEGSDMDAFYDTQTSQDASDVTSPEPPAEEEPSTATVTEAAVSPPPETPAAAGGDAPMEPAKEPSPAPALAPSPPKETAPARVETSPVPEVKVEEPPEDKVMEPDENGVAADPDSADKPRPKQINGVQLHYKEGQWSPSNPEGKKQYDRDFLLKLQANPESRKPPSLPNMPEILVDPQVFKMEDFQRQFSGRSCPVDFTPGFFKSTPRTGGPGSMNKRGSQQGRRGGPGSQAGEQQRIIPSLRQEIKLHKAEDAYKPMFQKEAAVEAGDEEKETQKLFRAFQSILNKLTPQKYAKLSKEAMELKIDTEERVIGVCNLIFEKAISESKFAMWYANLCKDMMKLKVPKTSNPNEFITFRAILLTKCQKEFESDTIVEGDLDRRRKELESADEDKKTQLLEELEEATVKARRRSMGNIRFIGELYRLKMLTENIMHDCIFKLLKIRDDDSIECLCKLLETIGKDLDHPKAKQRMDQYFAQFEKMTADMTAKEQGAWSTKDSTPSKPKESSKDKLCTRVKFSVLEIIDMRKNGWAQRQIHAQNKPTTIEEIHQKAKQEQQEAQFLNSQPRPDPSLAGRGAKGKGRGSMQGDSDGWNTVPAKPVRQQIDATKMKITKTNVDEITLTLGGGNKFSNWGRGSQGGGSRSQEQEKSGNRYNALNNLNDNDGRRGYGRSPARGDSRGGGRMGGDRDRDRRDRDRDFRKPPNRSSMEAERERALTSTRNILGGGGASNPSSRNASRDNSRSRDVPPPAAAKAPSGPDAKSMTADELDRRLNTIAEELHSNGSIKDAKDSFSEIQHLDYSQVVTTMLEKLVEKPGNTRKLLGQLLFDMVREKQITIEALIKGIAEFLSFAEDLELDIPKIYDNLAEVFAPLVQDNKVLPLNFLQAAVRPLVEQGNKKEAVLVQKILARAADYKSKDVVQAQWAASGLKFSDFGINEKSSSFELQWLKSPVRNTVYTGVCSLLQRPDCTNEEVFQWIDKNFSAEERETNQFIRELTSAICRSYINTATKKLDTEGLKQRVPLLRKYLDDDKERGTQALFAVQHLLCELEHPQGVVRSLFDLFYDEDIISEDSFFEWENRDGPPDDMVGKGVVKMNVKDFFDWLRSGGEEDKTS